MGDWQLVHFNELRGHYKRVINYTALLSTESDGKDLFPLPTLPPLVFKKKHTHPVMTGLSKMMEKEVGNTVAQREFPNCQIFRYEACLAMEANMTWKARQLAVHRGNGQKAPTA